MSRAVIILFRLIIVVGVGSLLRSLLSSKSFDIRKESNAHDEFLQFNRNLDIPESKLKKLIVAYSAIKKRLKKYFKDHPEFTTPLFAKQGSSETGTLIRTYDDHCDFDIGLYFLEKPNRTYKVIQTHISKALSGHTALIPKHLEYCTRLQYQGGFHIDLPIYYREDNKFYLGCKTGDWEICDSKLFKDWVTKEINGNDQMIRIVRYLKAWADSYHKKRHIKMPNGLVFTIWGVKYYQKHERDDVALILTVFRILKYLKLNLKMTWTCEMPVEPGDNVLDRLDGNQQSNFFRAFKEFGDKGVTALSKQSKVDSLKIWASLLGKRFPQ